MIEDLWQLGGALLFREQDQPEAAAAALASVLGKVPVSLEGAGEIGVSEEWQMLGAGRAWPPQALALAADQACAPLTLAGMEAAAEALRLEDPDLFGQLAEETAPHTAEGPQHYLIHRHPLSAEPCLYPPPGFHKRDWGKRLQLHVTRPRFSYTHEWMPGDVLAFDPTAVRCRSELRRKGTFQAVVIPGAGPLVPMRAPVRNPI